MGDYTEIESWIASGRVDCGFLRIHTRSDFDILPLAKDRLLAILPELILRRIPYHIVIRELDVPASRTIAFALRDRNTASLAVKRFMDYLDYRS